jgi:hypothetical protein
VEVVRCLLLSVGTSGQLVLKPFVKEFVPMQAKKREQLLGAHQALHQKLSLAGQKARGAPSGL